MANEKITSTQNTRVKHLINLQQKSASRRREGLFVIEGAREIGHCAESGYEPTELFFCPDILAQYSLSESVRQLLNGPMATEVSAEVYDKMAYRGGTEGIIAVVRAKEHRLSDLHLLQDALVMVLESVEKPGNLGAILRSADAAGADAVIVCDPKTDLYNPNLIRASIGSVFTVPIAACSSEECISFLKDNGISILTAQLQDSRPYYDTDMTHATAIVMGTEATGLTPAWRQAADAHILIPMLGRLDSLNVSVSAAILLFEAVRQRQGQRQQRECSKGNEQYSK